VKRDFALIRAILLDLEAAKPRTTWTKFEYEGYSDSVVIEHLEILIESGLIVGRIVETLDDSGTPMISRLSWTGHDFLDAMRDETIWNRAKNTILKRAGGITFDILIDWLKWQMRTQVGLPD
jgi:hypothetical protein